jgi:hypothetical protein
LIESADVYAEWKRLVVAHGVTGVQAHDARLVAAMKVYGIKRILTFNTQDFARYDDIRPSGPSDSAYLRTSRRRRSDAAAEVRNSVAASKR